jgi:hypothetical protein
VSQGAAFFAEGPDFVVAIAVTERPSVHHAADRDARLLQDEVLETHPIEVEILADGPQQFAALAGSSRCPAPQPPGLGPQFGQVDLPIGPIVDCAIAGIPGDG